MLPISRQGGYTLISLIVLRVSMVTLRGAAWLGIRGFASWREAGRYGLAVMFVFTGIPHFTGIKHDFAAMILNPIPNDLWVIYLTGVLEIAGAIGLLNSRSLAGKPCWVIA